MRLLRTVLAAVAIFGCANVLLVAAEPPPVELITDTTVLQPTSTLEFRFVKPMISREEIGINPKDSPITFSPAMPGTFTWLSRSSGVFNPQGPLPLGVTYTVSLRNGLKAADGKTLVPTRWTLKTPPFGQVAMKGGGEDDERVEPRPRIIFAYNLPVDLNVASELFQFVNAKGVKVPAKVRYGTDRDYFHLPLESRDWEARWKAAQSGGQQTHPEDEEEGGEESAEETVPDDGDFGALGTPIQSQLAVLPTQTLTPGAAWRLEMKRGLRSLDGKYRIADGRTFQLGTVEPFDIAEIIPSAYVNSGRSAIIRFSRALAPDITPENAAKYFRVEPEVPGLKFEGWDSELTMRGEFALGREYRLITSRDVVSDDGLPLSNPAPRPFQFKPVAPRLYLPEITAHQIRGGQRKFNVLSANLKSLRVIAKLVAPESIAQAVESFRKYEAEDGGSEEPYRALPEGLIEGQVIHDKTLEFPQQQPVDTRQETVLDWNEIVGAQKAGAIFLTVEGQPRADVEGSRVGAQALVQLTDLGILWKQLEGAVRVTVFSMASGKPVAGANLALLNPEFAPMSTGQTDAMGSIDLKMEAAPKWLTASKGDDAFAMRMGEGAEELPMAAFRLPIDYPGWAATPKPELPLRGFIFTDRPLYRPGEMAHLKGYVRRMDSTEIARSAGIVGKLKITDPRGRELPPIEVKTDERGAFDTVIQLGEDNTGTFLVSLEFPDAQNLPYSRSTRCNFLVADFQPNAFEVEMNIPARIGPGEEVKTRVSAKYLFGAPITKADVRWTLQYVSEGFSPEGFYNWQFGDPEAGNAKTLTLRGEGTLNGTDGLPIEPRLPAVTDSPGRGVLTAEVTDLNQQTVSEKVMFTRDASDFYLGQEAIDGIIFRPGEDIVTRAIAVKPNGQPLPQPVTVEAELLYVKHDTVRVQGAGKAISFRTEKTEESIAKGKGQTLIPRLEQDAWKAEGETVRLKAEKAGQYKVRLTATDTSGRKVVSVLPVFVSGADEVGWDYRNPAQVELIADKGEYKAGDTARIMVKAPISGEAWVSIERDRRVLRTMLVKLEGNAPVIEVPLKAEDLPNVYVSMVLVRGLEQSTRQFKMPEYRYGATMLRMTDPLGGLQVAIKPAKSELQPGDEVVSTILVTDSKGAPAKDAEVTFFAVDDGILALTGYDRPQPGGIFTQPFPLAIRTGISLYNLLPEDPGALEFANKGYLIGGGGLEGPGLKLRSEFPGTACWFPSLRTDAEGRVLVKFKAPDAITRYRLVAVAAAAAGITQFGSAESAFAIRKPLMLLPSLGQFANVGDQILARAVVRNDSGADSEVNVTLSLDAGAEPVKPGADALQAKLLIKHGESRAIDFPVQLKSMGVSQWKWEARMNAGGKELEDQVLSKLSVGSASPVLRETYITDLTQPSTDLLAGVNPQLIEGTGTVDVNVANTRLATLRESASQLLEYPYRCAEQTISTTIPWMLTKQLGPVIPELNKPGDEVEKTISKGMDRLFAMQQPAGGITMWPEAPHPSRFVSAYAALACALLPEGIDPPAGVPELLKYLSEELRGLAKVRDEMALGDRALALYALALHGKAEPAYHEELYRRRKELSYESRALLALAIQEAKGPDAMVKDLLNPKNTAPEAYSFFGSGARERAVQLVAWSRVMPRDNEVGRLVKELLGYRVNGHWGTTQQNAWALLALARYYSAAETGTKASKGELIVGPRKDPFLLTDAKPAISTTLGFNPAAALGSLTVSNPEKGLLFGETRFIVRPPLANQPKQDRGYSVTRNYQKLANDGTLQPADELKVGDRLLVSLQIQTARPGHFVAIDDPLPAVLDAVNPNFESKQVGGAVATRNWVADFQEIRADRVLYFCDHLPPGAYTFRYLARVRSAGEVVAGPTKAEEMYRPERFGLSESAKVVARPSDTP
jgi:uncharacterized protein YfaS (alpha-2-macroglobulin family)